MKKLLCLLLAGALAFSVAACGNGAQDSEAAEAADTSDTAETGEAEDAAEETAEEDGQNILIAYFSWSGNTEALAGMIQSETGGELFEIEPAEPYTEDYDALLDQAQQEQQENARPELAAQVENWDSYDVVFVGYPNWWSDAPMAVLSFLEFYDCTGKIIVPFNTSGGGGFGSIEESAAGAEILEGFTVAGDNVSGAQADVSEWISGLGLELAQ